jgi:hypothetical protein
MGHCRFLACALTFLCLTADALAAACLTGNDAKGPNVRLKDACYRVLWTQTHQPKPPADSRYRGWVPFTEGALTNGQADEMDYVNIYTRPCNLYTYTWSPDDYTVEVDLGQLCEVSAITLEANQKWTTLRAWYPAPQRWLPVAHNEDGKTLKVTGLNCRTLRIDIGACAKTGAVFSEMYIWGAPLGEKAEEARPPPLPPKEASVPYTPLTLKVSGAPLLAPDPFVMPQPQEMEFGEERVRLPRNAALVLPENASPPLREIAETFRELIGAIVDLDLQVGPPGEGPAIRLGLAADPGPFADLAARRRIAPGALPPEGYAVEITREGATLTALDDAGLLHAARTLVFLARPEMAGGVSLPVGWVRDFPREPMRPVFGYGGWRSDFKTRVLTLHMLLKSNMAHGGTTPKSLEMMRRNRVASVRGVSMYPGSACGTDGDLLEMAAGQKKQNLDLRRLSACCSHTNFWPGMFRAFPSEPARAPVTAVDISHDEIMHNPWMICPRCRARGLTQREMLADNFLKAYAYLRARGYTVVLYCTGFKYVSKAFDMFLDIPTEGVVTVNYVRPDVNTAMRERGFATIAGNTRAFQMKPEEGAQGSMVWWWGLENRINLMGGVLQNQLMQDEQNWSGPARADVGSPAWEARLNRLMQYARAVIDGAPLDPPELKREYFTVDITPRANRSLRDETWGDGQGWLDEGPTRDLRHLPAGDHTWAGVPWRIGAGDRAAILVAGPGAADRFLPDQVLGLPVGRAAGRLLFLHACSRRIWTNYLRSCVLIGLYRIHYADGSSISAPVYYKQHLLEWTRNFGYRTMETAPTASPAGEAAVAWRGSTDGGQDVTLYAMTWLNPYPEKAIASVDVLASAQMESNANVLCLLGISGTVPTPQELTHAARQKDRPPLRQWRPRPELPPGVVSLDMTRRTLHPKMVLADPAGARTWKTADNWFHLTTSNVVYEKGEVAFGAYSALDPDDEPWRGAIEDTATPSELTLKFKRLIPLRGFGVKGAMQRPVAPGVFPCNFTVELMNENGDFRKFATVREHIGQEGEERWVFEKETPVAGLRFRLASGPGISAIYLYARPNAIDAVRADSVDKIDDMLKGRKTTAEDAKDALDGL